MRRVMIASLLATLFVAVLSAPAAAEPDDKAEVIPLDYSFEAWNPCTEAAAPTHFVGELSVRALPSIDAFYADEWTHLTLKWSGQFVAEDGYATATKHYATQVANAPENTAHAVVNEVDNIVFSSEDGGKYKVTYRFHVTIVDGNVKSVSDSFDAVCIRRPED